MADDQANNAYAAWSATVDNNIIGLFTGTTTLTPVDDLPSGILEDAIPQGLIAPYRDAVLGTIWETGDSEPPEFIDPDPQILSKVVDEDGRARFVGEAGPTDAPYVTIRWEVDMQPSIRICLLEKVNELMPLRETIDDTIQLPTTLSLKDGVVRLTVIPQTDLLTVT